MAPTVFSLIGSSWAFYRKQPVLNHVLLWLMVIPTTITFYLAVLEETHPYFMRLRDEGINFGTTDLRLGALVSVADLVVTILIIWGSACIFIVGKKLAASKAGRSRTSFSVVREQGSKLILNLLITDILRSCITVFWALLYIIPVIGLSSALEPELLSTPLGIAIVVGLLPLLIPAIAYYTQTVLYPVVIVVEGIGYRKSLKRSKEMIKGRILKMLGYELGLGVTLFAPVILCTILLGLVAEYDVRLSMLAYMASAILIALSTTLMLLSHITLYAHFKKAS